MHPPHLHLTPRYVRAHLVGHCEGRCQHRTFDSSRSLGRLRWMYPEMLEKKIHVFYRNFMKKMKRFMEVRFELCEPFAEVY